jgi:hypothetical protein
MAKVLCESVEQIGRSEVGFGGVDLQDVVHHVLPSLDRSDRCF